MAKCRLDIFTDYVNGTREHIKLNFNSFSEAADYADCVKGYPHFNSIFILEQREIDGKYDVLEMVK